VTGSDDARRTVLDAVDHGSIPPGGPSELASRGLVNEAPAGYWERWEGKAAKRIRATQPPPASSVRPEVQAEAGLQVELGRLARARGLTIAELERLAIQDGLRPREKWRTVIRTEDLVRWGRRAT
jgi:hypothetical protein